MTSRERVRRAVEFASPDRAPREVWALPGVTVERKDEWEEFLRRFPLDTTGPDVKYGTGRRVRGTEYEVGAYVDAWGCVWHVAEFGVIGEVKEPPLADWAALDSYSLPWELLDEADWSRCAASCAATDKYVKGGGQTRPFERMQFLRGPQNLYCDLAWQPAELFRLRDMLHEFFCREMSLWARTDVDGVGFMDDWGSNNSLLISPAMWREFYKPLYRDYCDIIHAGGKHVWFHTDGHTAAIWEDLIEIGVDVLNSQLFTMDIEELGRKHRGRICVYGEIDRQHVLPFGTPDDCRAAVRRVRRAFESPAGGAICTFEWGKPDPFENALAICDEWARPIEQALL